MLYDLIYDCSPIAEREKAKIEVTPGKEQAKPSKCVLEGVGASRAWAKPNGENNGGEFMFNTLAVVQMTE
jgi:hypothetical protein